MSPETLEILARTPDPVWYEPRRSLEDYCEHLTARLPVKMLAVEFVFDKWTAIPADAETASLGYIRQSDNKAVRRKNSNLMGALRGEWMTRAGICANSNMHQIASGRQGMSAEGYDDISRKGINLAAVAYSTDPEHLDYLELFVGCSFSGFREAVCQKGASSLRYRHDGCARSL